METARREYSEAAARADLVDVEEGEEVERGRKSQRRRRHRRTGREAWGSCARREGEPGALPLGVDLGGQRGGEEPGIGELRERSWIWCPGGRRCERSSMFASFFSGT